MESLIQLETEFMEKEISQSTDLLSTHTFYSFCQSGREVEEFMMQGWIWDIEVDGDCDRYGFGEY